jgi:release factor glutamine methyltransferase
VARAERDRIEAVIARGVAPAEARWLVQDHLSDATGDALNVAVTRRLSGEPLQYVLGHWPFRRLDLVVDPRVLIPRPETEQLVDVALATVTEGVAELAVLDVGCGSGAIGLALVTELADRRVTASLTALDESADALDVARENAARYGVRATFVPSNWYDALGDGDLGRFDIIVANPPYVSVFELDDVDPVVAYEPSGAVISGEGDGVPGFADLAHVIGNARRWMTDGATLVCEHGSSHGRAARAAADAAGLTSSTVVDIAGHDRFLVARA